MKPEKVILHRNSSNCRSSRNILPANYVRSTPFTPDTNAVSDRPLVHKYGGAAVSFTWPNKNRNIGILLRSLLRFISLPFIIPTGSTCRWLSIPSRFSPAPSLGRKVTGTLFGHKKGHVSFVVQDHPRSEPVIILELAMSTSALVKEMSTGLVRIALECDKGSTCGSGGRSSVKLFQEPVWTMYCNGRKCGYAVARTCGDSDCHLLSTVQTVSVGAGVIPADKSRIGDRSVWEGELMYMRARFERVVGSRDSEAFYMMNPDGTGGPELSIFLLRI
ncbi:protein MIZU-KUSSEI 1-like [Macadamia integrifolia]|uniref:protein MIZU-KUSSEI 1-like n=1 Tax=Macadamia integrifolia TaxID=60698 RepID=UPI001C4F5A14|nr:protein MIZU-KUSSEI 1-like [Macadamia integrifolia]